MKTLIIVEIDVIINEVFYLINCLDLYPINTFILKYPKMIILKGYILQLFVLCDYGD